MNMWIDMNDTLPPGCKGCAVITRLIENFDYVLVLPDGDSRVNNYIRSAFGAKLGNRCGVVVEGQEAEDLLALYSLYAFTDKLIIGSLDLPPGRRLRNLLQSGIATEEELIDDVILGAM
jgi:hypothetical protein